MFIHNVIQYVRKYWFFPSVVVTILIGFNGYLSPTQVRMFGDLSPNAVFSTRETGYQFYGEQFLSNFKPINNAPFRFFSDYIRVFFENYASFSPYTSHWLVVMLPLLLSIFGSVFFFGLFTKQKWIVYFSWLVYTFSTFVLFTSSIHTEIIIAINTVLCGIYLVHRWMSKERSFTASSVFGFLLGGIVSYALLFDMRMVIFYIPFFAALLILSLYYHKDVYVRHNVIKWLIMCGTAFATMGSNFFFLFATFGKTTATVSSLVGRSTWGNAYFQFINVISLSHPFWNNSEPINFIYNSPSYIHLLNIGGIVLLGFIVIYHQRSLKPLILSLPLFVLALLLAKQNNPPITGLYDFFFQFPYFNLAREASKYYYFIILSLVVYIAIVLQHTDTKKYLRYIKYTMVTLFLIPVLGNIIVFSTGMYGQSTVPYDGDIQIYNNINTFIDSQNAATVEKRVLWLPLSPALINNTQTVRHISFSRMKSLYPLYNDATLINSPLDTAVKNGDMQNYIALMGIDYFIIPNLKNERSIVDQLDVQYSNTFILEEYTTYIEQNMPITRIADIEGYMVYTWKSEIKPQLQVISQPLASYKYTSTQELVLFDKRMVDLSQKNQEPFSSVIASNCNNNTELGLGFQPNERITIADNSDTSVTISMGARLEELPCIIIDIPRSQDTNFISFADFSGSSIDAVLYSNENTSNRTLSSFSVLPGEDASSIPLNCTFVESCQLYLYLRGDSALKMEMTSFTVSLLSARAETDTAEQNLNQSIGLYQSPITNLKYTPLNYAYITPISSRDGISNQSSQYDYIILPYQYDQGFVLHINDTFKLKPMKTNLNLLVFNTSGLSVQSMYLENIDEVSMNPYIMYALFSWLSTCFGMAFIFLYVSLGKYSIL